MPTNATTGTPDTSYTPTPAPPATVQALLTALLHGVPFLAPQPSAAAGDRPAPAWLQAAAWPMVPSRTPTADAG